MPVCVKCMCVFSGIFLFLCIVMFEQFKLYELRGGGGGQTDGQTDRETVRQTDRQRQRHTQRQTDTERQRETDGQR